MEYEFVPFYLQTSHLRRFSKLIQAIYVSGSATCAFDCLIPSDKKNNIRIARKG